MSEIIISNSEEFSDFGKDLLVMVQFLLYSWNHAFILQKWETVYQGTKSSVVMFETVVGHSFKCVSEQSIQLSTRLQLKTMNVQYQAFDFEDDHFGNADECFTDRNRRENPVAVGLSIAVLLIVLLTACLVASKRPSRGYERM